MTANTTGYANSAFGHASLRQNTTGSFNTALGDTSLQMNITGDFNTAVGTLSLRMKTTGSSNAAFGYNSLAANTSGYYNAAFGTGSLAANTTGTANVVVGYHSLDTNTTGTGNAALGYESLRATTGASTVGVGYAAGLYNTTGSSNTFVGTWAGPDSANGALTYATAVAFGATVTQSNALVLGGVNGTASAVNVGIGTSAPDTKLQVVGDIKVGTAGTNGCLKNFAGTGLIGTCSSDARLKAHVWPFEPVLDKVTRLRPVHYTWRAAEFPEYHFGAGRVVTRFARPSTA